jgi:hypothetical protein
VRHAVRINKAVTTDGYSCAANFGEKQKSLLCYITSLTLIDFALKRTRHPAQG